MGDTPHLLIIIGSTRDRRRGEPIARWLADVVAAREDITCELVDLAAFELPFLTAATPPMSQGSREEAASEWAKKVASADGYLIVVPEYNHGYPAAIKNALDHLFASGTASRSASPRTAAPEAECGPSSSCARSRSSSTWCQCAARWRCRASGRRSTRAESCSSHPRTTRARCSTTWPGGRGHCARRAGRRLT